MCLNPKWIYKKGFYKEDNYRGEKGQFYELGTYSKCGSCEICMNEKSNNWAIRNYYEEKMHEKKCFITLTYAENPIILIKKDLQDFFKRLRINLDRTTGEKIRMFGAGEYGTLHQRPHFHAIIYGWEDENINYLGINNKKNILYSSDVIKNAWGLGRISYQKFEPKEIPYTAQYATPQEKFKNAYKMTMKKYNFIKDLFYGSKNISEERRKMLLEELEKLRKEMEEEKKQYKIIREYNTWSIGLGWESFKKEYDKQKTKTFSEFIEGKEFVTPSPWVKKLANLGDKNAKEEMFRRESLIIQSLSEEDEKNKNIMKVATRKKEEILSWSDEKTKITGYL